MQRKNRAVPVLNREKEIRATRPKRTPVRLGLEAYAAIIAAVAFVIVIIYVPVRDYMEQRSEIDRLEVSISQLTKQKDKLQDDLNHYQSEEYIREQARIRLGVIAPGERAFRIIDPGLENSRHTQAVSPKNEEIRIWYETLWDSVTVIPEEDEQPPRENKLPLLSDLQAPVPSAPEEGER
ncbi:septum formation initiator family protein [Corynebacterium sp. ES2775-CONJ]|uniref:FtsB family cell division protein n=1 Tax=Corynebacterium sp. ES2775-CONJ TaxID=2974029 RepID=UPI0021693C82|nr:septum formation initiator family protein [Corynebacterium sp. ES2775-CONJ]MCS4489949.1 septum formation initiator family protein [Corynebacterium sp. ES2775-CONJ]